MSDAFSSSATFIPVNNSYKFPTDTSRTIVIGTEQITYDNSTFPDTLMRAGATGTETFIAQSTWNLDVMDGSLSSSNPSGTLLDPTKYYIYQNGMQYLGVGSVMFDIVVDNRTNNNTWSRVHSIQNPNSLVNTHI